MSKDIDDDDFIKNQLISKPLVKNSARVTVSANRLAKIKDLNQKLESLSTDPNIEELNVINKRISDNKQHISEIKSLLPSDKQVKQLKELLQENQAKKEKLDKVTTEIDKLSEECDKYDQAKAFLSILIEKTITSIYPTFKKDDNIHEKLIHSVEEDSNFQYGSDLLNLIKNAKTPK
ncbi:hypothetical protein M9Y10_025912 [Tritrichomonas musculus]|uniref:Uncharacterized protein n=1 Tax=Tritrichomonas musculus TaxID=1915356 RepID=A0ABR2H7Z4_9EUKA